VKATPDRRDMVMMVVSLDPHHVQHGFVQAPVWELETTGDGGFFVDDLLSGARFTWRGERTYVRLNPDYPAHILRLPGRPVSSQV
jgi:starch synthase (maltosyl-transferring)